MENIFLDDMMDEVMEETMAELFRTNDPDTVEELMEMFATPNSSPISTDPDSDDETTVKPSVISGISTSNDKGIVSVQHESNMVKIDTRLLAQLLVQNTLMRQQLSQAHERIHELELKLALNKRGRHSTADQHLGLLRRTFFGCSDIALQVRRIETRAGTPHKAFQILSPSK